MLVKNIALKIADLLKWEDYSSLRASCKKIYFWLEAPRKKFTDKMLIKTNDFYQYYMKPERFVILTMELEGESKEYIMNKIGRNMDFIMKSGLFEYFCEFQNIPLYKLMFHAYRNNDTLFLHLLENNDSDWADLLKVLFEIEYNATLFPHLVKKLKRIIYYEDIPIEFYAALCENPVLKPDLVYFATQNEECIPYLAKKIKLTVEDQNQLIATVPVGSPYIKYLPDAVYKPNLKKILNVDIKYFEEYEGPVHFSSIHEALKIGRLDIARVLEKKL